MEKTGYYCRTDPQNRQKLKLDHEKIQRKKTKYNFNDFVISNITKPVCHQRFDLIR